MKIINAVVLDEQEDCNTYFILSGRAGLYLRIYEDAYEELSIEYIGEKQLKSIYGEKVYKLVKNLK